MKTASSLFIIVFTLLAYSISYGDDIIRGHYCYTYGDNESLKEARELTRSLAIRDAIESYKVFVESSTNVTDFKLTSDIIQIISSGYLSDIKVISHTEEGRKICDVIQAKVNGKAIENIVKREVQKRRQKTEEIGLDNNGYIKILRVRATDNNIYATVKVLQNTGSLSVSYERNRAPQFRVCFDIYDSNGDPIGGQCVFIHYDGTEMIAGQITNVSAYFHGGFKSYRVWLPRN